MICLLTALTAALALLIDFSESLRLGLRSVREAFAKGVGR